MCSGQGDKGPGQGPGHLIIHIAEIVINMFQRQHQESAFGTPAITRSNGGQPLVQHFEAEFQDIDVLAQTVAGWDLDWRQLDRGPLEARVQQLITPSVLVGRVGCSRGYHQRGATPPGFLTFGCLRRGTGDLDWCGQRASGGSLLVFRPGGEYESFSPPGFGAYTMSFSEHLLDREAHARGLPEARSFLLGANRALAVDPKVLSMLKARLRVLFEAPETRPSVTASPAFRREVEGTLAVELLEVLATGRSRHPPASPSLRSRAARRALDLIRDRPEEVLTVGDLCEEVGVSERTLRYAFRDLLGVSPKQYLQAMRLSGASRDLRSSSTGTRVADVANCWGFWHMGQFAADYRRQFGELPSETLARRR